MDANIQTKIIDAVSRSGFPLEHQVMNILRDKGWQTITNRYYIDDIKGVEREVDILAYKTYNDDIERISYITTLVISCKKSDKSKWCFLTRKANHYDANVNWTPLHYCTTDARLNYMSLYHKNIVIDEYRHHRAIKILYNFPKMVFAFQQMSEKTVDRKTIYEITKNEQIYDSIITSIKAVDAEKHSRIEKRKNDEYKRYYTFHILSIFDGAMYEDFFDESGEQHVNDLKEIKYLNRHIVNKIDDFYIVNFIHIDELNYRLKLFDILHSQNERTLPKLLTSFYVNIFSSEDRVNLVKKDFENQVLWFIIHKINLLNDETIDKIDVGYNMSDDGVLEIQLLSMQPLDHIIQDLNNDKELTSRIKSSLDKVFRYTGKFKLTNDFPF